MAMWMCGKCATPVQTTGSAPDHCFSCGERVWNEIKNEKPTDYIREWADNMTERLKTMKDAPEDVLLFSFVHPTGVAYRVYGPADDRNDCWDRFIDMKEDMARLHILAPKYRLERV